MDTRQGRKGESEVLEHTASTLRMVFFFSFGNDTL
jgi:hypothetical protein